MPCSSPRKVNETEFLIVKEGMPVGATIFSHSTSVFGHWRHNPTPQCSTQCVVNVNSGTLVEKAALLCDLLPQQLIGDLDGI